jgi:hypothetical protein
MKGTARKIDPEEYILAVLSPPERLDAALRVAREAFRDSTLSVADVEAAVRRVRRKHHVARRPKAADRH